MKTVRQTLIPLLAATPLLLLYGLSYAQPAPASAAANASAELTTGEIRKVDKENKKITIKHGPLTNLDMPGMTMVFQAGNDSMLDQVSAGDKVQFRAEKIDGKITVTKIEAEK